MQLKTRFSQIFPSRTSETGDQECGEKIWRYATCSTWMLCGAVFSQSERFKQQKNDLLSSLAENLKVHELEEIASIFVKPIKS